MSQRDLILILAIGAFAIVWPFTLVWLMSFVTGWRRLAAEFPARGQGAIAGKGVTSLLLGGVGRFNNCILWRADEEHLHLRMTPPFHTGYAPISIPWGEMTEVRAARHSRRFAVVVARGVRFEIGRGAVEQELAAREALEAEAPAGAGVS